MPFLKLILFGSILLVVLITGWYSYKRLNREIINSQRLLPILCYTGLLIAVNLVLLVGGVFVLLKTYELFFGD